MDVSNTSMINTSNIAGQPIMYENSIDVTYDAKLDPNTSTMSGMQNTSIIGINNNQNT